MGKGGGGSNIHTNNKLGQLISDFNYNLPDELLIIKPGPKLHVDNTERHVSQFIPDFKILIKKLHDIYQLFHYHLCFIFT